MKVAFNLSVLVEGHPSINNSMKVSKWNSFILSRKAY